MKHLAIVFVLSVLCPTAFAIMGHEGNGGDVVVCRDSSGAITSVEVLDLYEAREMRQLVPALGSTGSIASMLNIVRGRLNKYSPATAEHLMNQADEFILTANMVSNVVLTDISDSHHLYLPRGCEVEQIAIQREPAFDGDYLHYYTVSKDLWDMLDNQNKVTLIMHEVLYRMAVEQGHTNSLLARYINSIILSDRFDNVSAADYFRTWQTAKYMRLPVQNNMSIALASPLSVTGYFPLPIQQNGDILDVSVISSDGSVPLNAAGVTLEWDHYIKRGTPFRLKLKENGAGFNFHQMDSLYNLNRVGPADSQYFAQPNADTRDVIAYRMDDMICYRRVNYDAPHGSSSHNTVILPIVNQTIIWSPRGSKMSISKTGELLLVKDWRAAGCLEKDGTIHTFTVP